jgi:hypothetical protein
LRFFCIMRSISCSRSRSSSSTFRHNRVNR